MPDNGSRDRTHRPKNPAKAEQGSKPPTHPEGAPAENAPAEPAPEAAPPKPEAETPPPDPRLEPAGPESPEEEVREEPTEAETVKMPRVEVVGGVEFSPEGGAYPSSVVVSLSCPTEGTEIRYALDGSDPDATSPLYDAEAGLLLRGSATVRARAYKEGYPGPVSEAGYEVRAAIWQENEPEDRADEVDHTSTWGAGSGGWRIAGASSRGKLHAHRALWREDAFGFRPAEEAGGWTAIAVSDGAGSAPLSRVGARLACESALAHVEERLADFSLVSEDEDGLKGSEMPRLLGFLAGAAGAALAAIRAEAAARSRGPEEFAATLLVVVHRRWRGRHLVGAVQVGDGCVALLDWDDGVTLLGVPDHGEHSSETRFLTTQGVEGTFPNRVLFSVKDRLRCVAVMSDGVSDDFFPEEKRVPELLLGENLPGLLGSDGHPVRGVLGRVEGASDPAEALLEWIRYEKRGSSDDRTLVLFWDEG